MNAAPNITTLDLDAEQARALAWALDFALRNAAYSAGERATVQSIADQLATDVEVEAAYLAAIADGDATNSAAGIEAQRRGLVL